VTVSHENSHKGTKAQRNTKRFIIKKILATWCLVGKRFHGLRGGSHHEELLCNNWNQVNFPLPSYPLTFSPSFSPVCVRPCSSVAKDFFQKRLTFFPPFAIRYSQDKWNKENGQVNI